MGDAPLRGKGKVTSARTRTDPPDIDDPGLVVRPIGPVGPVIFDWGTSTLENGHETIVGAAAVLVLAADPDRKTAVIQNTGSVNARIGVAGVTPTTGIRLIPNAVLILDEPFIYTGDVFAVSEGADTTVFATEAE